MAIYSHLGEVSAARRYGNTGQGGWGFTLLSDLIDNKAPHRDVLKRFAARYPRAGIQLPEYDRYEDFVQCDAVWNSAYVSIYYETTLSHLFVWAADRDTAESIRAALLPFTNRA